MEQAKNRLQRVLNYMKKPEFLLLLGLVNLFLILCMGSRLHRVMYFNNAGYGMQKSHMMKRGYDDHGGRGMMNKQQYYPSQNGDMPVDQNAQPETAPVDQATMQPTTTGSTTP